MRTSDQLVAALGGMERYEEALRCLHRYSPENATNAIADFLETMDAADGVKAERERCVKIARDAESRAAKHRSDHTEYWHGQEHAAEMIGDAIEEGTE